MNLLGYIGRALGLTCIVLLPLVGAVALSYLAYVMWGSVASIVVLVVGCCLALAVVVGTAQWWIDNHVT